MFLLFGIREKESHAGTWKLTESKKLSYHFQLLFAKISQLIFWLVYSAVGHLGASIQHNKDKQQSYGIQIVYDIQNINNSRTIQTATSPSSNSQKLKALNYL